MKRTPCLLAAAALAALTYACTSDGKPRPPTPGELEAARRVLCAAFPERCPRPVPTVVAVTPTPSPAPTVAPTAEATATPRPAVEPTSSPTLPPARPTPTPAPAIPTGPVKPAKPFGPCPRGTQELVIGAQRLCLSNWTCADGIQSNNCHTRTWVGFGGHGIDARVDQDGNTCSAHLCVTPDGWVRDLGKDWLTDMYCRAVELDGRSFLSWAPPGREYEPNAVCHPVPTTAPTPEPTPTPVGVTPTPPAPGTCPPLHEVEWDVLRIALKTDRSTPDEDGDGRPDRDGSAERPAVADTDIIVGHITPKMVRPHCPNDRIICELTRECQDQLVGRPLVTQTLAGVFENHDVVHNSSNAFITFQNLAPGEVGKYEMRACTQWGTHCTTSFVWVR